MSVLLRQFRDNPAVAISVLVALLAAAIAIGSVLASGGAVLVAVLAGLSSLLTAVSGGQAIRANVVPFEKHEEIVSKALRVDADGSIMDARKALADERYLG